MCVYTLAQRRVADDGAEEAPMSEATTRRMHQTVQKVTADVENLSFNTDWRSLKDAFASPTFVDGQGALVTFHGIRDHEVVRRESA